MASPAVNSATGAAGVRSAWGATPCCAAALRAAVRELSTVTPGRLTSVGGGRRPLVAVVVSAGAARGVAAGAGVGGIKVGDARRGFACACSA